MEKVTKTFEIEYAKFLFSIEVEHAVDSESNSSPVIDSTKVKKVTVTSETNKSVLFEGDLLELNPLERFIPAHIYIKALEENEKSTIEDFTAYWAEHRNSRLSRAHGVE